MSFIFLSYHCNETLVASTSESIDLPDFELSISENYVCELVKYEDEFFCELSLDKEEVIMHIIDSNQSISIGTEIYEVALMLFCHSEQPELTFHFTKSTIDIAITSSNVSDLFNNEVLEISFDNANFHYEYQNSQTEFELQNTNLLSNNVNKQMEGYLSALTKMTTVIVKTSFFVPLANHLISITIILYESMLSNLSNQQKVANVLSINIWHILLLVLLLGGILTIALLCLNLCVLLNKKSNEEEWQFKPLFVFSDIELLPEDEDKETNHISSKYREILNYTTPNEKDIRQINEVKGLCIESLRNLPTEK